MGSGSSPALSLHCSRMGLCGGNWTVQYRDVVDCLLYEVVLPHELTLDANVRRFSFGGCIVGVGRYLCLGRTNNGSCSNQHSTLDYPRVVVGDITISVVDTCARRNSSRVLFVGSRHNFLFFPISISRAEASVQHKRSQCHKRCEIRESAQGGLQHGSV